MAIAKRKRPAARVAVWKYLLGIWMMWVVLGAFLYAGEAQNFAAGTARIMFFHLPVAELSFIAFWTSMAYAIQYLQRRSPLSDLKSVCAAELGLLLALLATLSGSVFAASNWNSFWNWDPRETSVLVVLLIYGAYFGLRSSIDIEDRRAALSAVYNIFAGIVMPFLYYVLPRIPSLHSSHPENIWGPGGMSSDQRVVLYSSLLGFLGLFIWMFQLRLRAGVLALRRDEELLPDGRVVELNR